MIKLLAVCSFAALLGGCSTPTLDQSAISALQGKSVVRLVHPTPKMMMLTPGNAAVAGFGLAGGVAAAASGAKEGGAAPMELPDPSLAIADKLAEQLSQRYGNKTVSNVVYKPTNGMPQVMALTQPLADYTLQVYTYNEIMAFYFTAPSRYRIIFTTIATLIDNKSQKPVAAAACVNQPEDTSIAATYDEMLANNGARAKLDLAAGAEFCAQKLSKDMFPDLLKR